ncbi:hypothetical protein V6N11_027679 [Hibiscus sabdariffa]|uniref:Uncharacterized protein n=1 Tax=Hibiscus sabdariffa TaxID=183260 RepID=A0ABR2N776_9ROSI
MKKSASPSLRVMCGNSYVGFRVCGNFVISGTNVMLIARSNIRRNGIIKLKSHPAIQVRKPKPGGRVVKTYIEFLDKQQIGYKSFSRTLQLLDASSSSIKSATSDLKTRSSVNRRKNANLGF